jgi:hypothetical protein
MAAFASNNSYYIDETSRAYMNARDKANKEKELLDKKKADYDKAALDYGYYTTTVNDYEAAQEAAIEGNYALAKEILLDKGQIYGQYADTVDAETARVLDALYEEAVDAGLKADETKRNFEAGVKGYTKEMVEEAEKGYKEALDAYATARTDAESVGEDFGDGMAKGMENKRSTLIGKVKSIVKAIIKASRDESDTHSPSRKMIDVFEDVGDGAVVGLENKTKDILSTARDQVGSLLDVYTGEADNGQSIYRGVQQAGVRKYNQMQERAASDTAGKLDKILAALEKGQILAIDGETLIGATADKMNEALGQRRILAARGAI